MNKKEFDSKRLSFYEKIGKRLIDKGLSFFGLIFLSPLFLIITLAIMIDDPGTVLFTQKRVGKDKRFIQIHKFRSMKMNTPSDVPTHMLSEPEQYITRVGKILRKYSLDELPQMWDIFCGSMSIIGPRPALWNQDDLVAEREKYGANNIFPGLTGWAQINGRDELEITEKAKLDGEYARILHSGSLRAFFFDIRCFFGTIHSVIYSKGVIEGGTGEIHKKVFCDDAEEGMKDYGYKKTFCIDKSARRHVLITGKDSYIGESFKHYAKEHYPNFKIDTIDMKKDCWRENSFEGYDTVFHVAGIAHADIGNTDEQEKELYYSVNTRLAIETALKAKKSGVKQFVLMSSMIIYGDSAVFGKPKIIDEYTAPKPVNFYGDSKWKADKGVRELGDDHFKTAVLRAPMIYGNGSKGNFSILERIAKKVPVFPDIENKRSMLYIENLCEFLCQLILAQESGVYFPQNSEYTKTSSLVKKINQLAEKTVYTTRLLNPVVWIGSKIPGKVSQLANKAFGSIVYSQHLSKYNGLDYRIYTLEDSIKHMEMEEVGKKGKKKVLIVASVASMIDQFNIPNIRLLQSMGYDVDVAANFFKGNTCTNERIQDLLAVLDELKVDSYQIDFERNIKHIRAVITALKQLDYVVKGKRSPLNEVKHHKGTGKYSFIHCHSPIGGAAGRIIARNNGVKAIYTAHGFHFYNRAPIKNWLIYYPIERFLSRWTDVLITINRQDYERAKRRFHMKKVKYIPGVGVDVTKIREYNYNRAKKRQELSIPESAFLIISVGELNDNKNHETIIRAIAKNKNRNVHYILCGTGPKESELAGLCQKLEVGDSVHFLGYRTDIIELLHASDLFAFPSKREGLGISAIEGMAAGLPLVTSDVGGIKDYLIDGKTGFSHRPTDINGFAKSIDRLYQDSELREKMKKSNLEYARKFDIVRVSRVMQNIYAKI